MKKILIMAMFCIILNSPNLHSNDFDNLDDLEYFDNEASYYKETISHWERNSATSLIASLNVLKNKSEQFFSIEESSCDGANHSLKALYKSNKNDFKLVISNSLNNVSKTKIYYVNKHESISFLKKINSKLHFGDFSYISMDAIDARCFRLKIKNGVMDRRLYVMSGGNLGSVGEVDDLENQISKLVQHGVLLPEILSNAP